MLHPNKHSNKHSLLLRTLLRKLQRKLQRSRLSLCIRLRSRYCALACLNL